MSHQPSQSFLATDAEIKAQLAARQRPLPLKGEDERPLPLSGVRISLSGDVAAREMQRHHAAQ